MVRDLILCYHSIWGSEEPGDTRKWGMKRRERSLPEAEFEKQIKWLSSFCDFVTVSEMITKPSNGRWRIAITFDDGYHDNVLYAMPVLRRFDAPMTWFVASKYIQEEDHLPWWDLSDQVLQVVKKPVKVHLADGIRTFDTRVQEQARALRHTLRTVFRDKRDSNWHRNYDNLWNLISEALPGPLNNSMSRVEQIQEALSVYPNVELAAHTHSHLNFFTDEQETQLDDLGKNISLLGEWTNNKTIAGFAYPYGSMQDNAARIALLAKCGISWAVTTDPDYYKGQNEYLIPRLVVQNSWSFGRFRFFVKNLSTARFLRKLKRALHV